MRTIKILIPTYLDHWRVLPLIDEVLAFSPGADVFASCLKASASVNRNACLYQISVGEKAVLIDDDVSGFYPGWLDDLLRGLELPGAVMVSARLLDLDGNFGPTCSRCYAHEPEEIEVKSNGTAVLPTAAIAFVHRGHRFDESYRGSGFEDGDWCHQYLAADPTARFFQSNRCRLVHANLMREQKGDNWTHNKRHFFSKWNAHAQHG